MYVEIPIYSS